MSRATPLRTAGIRRIHETAAVFDDESLPAEFLDVRQRFEQRRLWRSNLASVENCFLIGQPQQGPDTFRDFSHHRFSKVAINEASRERQSMLLS